MMDFFDEQRMCRLYEKFILEYYRTEHKELTACAPQIQWALSEDDDFDMLPKMQTDRYKTTKLSGVGRSDEELHKNVKGDVKWEKGTQINRSNEAVIKKWLDEVL